jgi:hypothetical protein
MAKKQDNAIYEPGELSRVRGNLGGIDETEAKRMAQILGGEVGTEKNAGNVKRETVELILPASKRKRSGRLVEVAGTSDDLDIDGKQNFLNPKTKTKDPADDPSIQLKTSYFERIKMYRYAAQFEFEIKNALQLFISILSFWGEPSDFVNPRFASRRMSLYFSRIEQLVTTTRGLFPRNNARRSERLKKTSPFVYAILNTIRYWNIERIDGDLAKIQSHPRSVRVAEFADILKAIYRPLFILEKLSTDVHIKGAYMLLGKVLYLENPAEPRERNLEFIRIALTAFADVRREVHFGLYPLLMKFISDRWFPYRQLFTERHYRLIAFLGVTEEEQIKMVDLSPEQVEAGNLEMEQEGAGEGTEEQEGSEQAVEEEDPNDPETAIRKARKLAAEAEQKALDRSLGVLETLFPKAGWERLSEYPDLYPYFSDVYMLRRGYDLIAPNDPLLQVAVLLHVLDDICAGLHFVTFGIVIGPDGAQVHIHDAIGEIIANWQRFIDESFAKEYLPRLTEYCHMLEHSADTRGTVYAKRTINELRWAKRLYFLPYYKFESIGPPPFQNKETIPVYSQVRALRKYLTMVAAGIEQGNRRGGSAAKAPCNGIENPWARYNFEIPNPVSRRMNALLGPDKQNNAAVVFFALSIATVLDYLLNNENSWAYDDSGGGLFRSLDGDGVIPLFGVTEKVDADKFFRNSLKRKEA